MRPKLFPAPAAALALALGSLAWVGPAARAFPPAPAFTIHGVARDPFGWALRATDRGVVVIKKNGAVIAEAPIGDGPRTGENFRALLAMDVNAADPYRVGAQAPGAGFTVEVRFPGSTMLVTSLTAAQSTVGQPGGMLFLDFTVGEDSDGDRIPDGWEWWQLGEAGIGPGDPRWSLATLGNGDFDGDGTSDYLEYLAGTFAFLAGDSLRLRIEGMEADGSARLRTFLVIDKTYRVESSPDLVNWTTASVRLATPTVAPLTTFTATNTVELPIYAVVPPNSPRLFYRLALVR